MSHLPTFINHQVKYTTDMKKTTLILIALTVFMFSFQKSELNHIVIFSGKIENPNSDSLQVLNVNQEIIKTIILNKDNTFRDTLYVSEGYYRIYDGSESTQVYLKPKFDFSLTLNTEEFDETIKYKGKGANENNYLAEKALLAESFGQLNYYGYYGKLPEKEFLNLTDSLHNVQINLLKTKNNLDKSFLFIESKTLEFDRLKKYSDFEGMKRYLTENKEFKVSDNFPNAYENIDLSNEKLMISPNYIGYIRSYLVIKSREDIDDDNKEADYTLAYVKTVKTDIIMEELLYIIGKWHMNYAKDLDVVYNEIKPTLINEKYLSEVTERYKALKKIERGATSPVFEFDDIDGKTVSLNDLKGKLVYIDIWATWCLPCLKEIPSLKEMEEHFNGKDVQFVSICTSDTEESWRKMVEDKQLGGIQLFAPKEKGEFFD